eukprot:scaffold26319_cov56-Phaeocystis_antarctica.AAC.5
MTRRAHRPLPRRWAQLCSHHAPNWTHRPHRACWAAAAARRVGSAPVAATRPMVQWRWSTCHRPCVSTRSRHGRRRRRWATSASRHSMPQCVPIHDSRRSVRREHPRRPVRRALRLPPQWRLARPCQSSTTGRSWWSGRGAAPRRLQGAEQPAEAERAYGCGRRSAGRDPSPRCYR